MKDLGERLKSPVVWSVVLSAAYAQTELLQTTECSLKQVVLGILLIILSAFGAINNPKDRDAM